MKYNAEPSGPASSIDEVLERLDCIIERSNREGNRLGVFAALYRKTTLRIKDGIETGEFDDGKRMARLDVVFANRYFEALERFQQGRQPSECWLVSFEAGHTKRPSLVRHLLLGMNAHINFDLAIATAEICRRHDLCNLKTDFDHINRILSEVFTQVRFDIDESWSWMKMLDRVNPELDDALVRLCMARARDRAWRIANQLDSFGRSGWAPVIQRLDRQVAFVGRLISRSFLRGGRVALAGARETIA